LRMKSAWTAVFRSSATRQAGAHCRRTRPSTART
jgi:hypothetical protein